MQPPVPPPTANTTLVAAIDPGKVTGLSYLIVSTEAFAAPIAHELYVDEFFEHFHETFRRLDSDQSAEMIVVCESFQISQRTLKTALSLDALDIIGWLKAEQKYLRHQPLVMQSPAQAKSFATDAKLKALGWFERTVDGHANDSMRHMLRYVCSTSHPIRDHVVAALAKEML